MGYFEWQEAQDALLRRMAREARELAITRQIQTMNGAQVIAYLLFG
jgi:hypothetical protein